MEYGNKLNLTRSLRTARGIKGTRQNVIVTRPSEIDQNQLLLVRFPNLGSDYTIVPGAANLSFNIKSDSTNDKNRTSVSKVGKAIVKNLAVKFEEIQIQSIDDFEVLHATETYGERNRKREMPLGKVSSLIIAAHAELY